MRHRRVLLAAVAITVLAASGCSDDPSAPPAAGPAGGVASAPSVISSSVPAPVPSATTSTPATTPAGGVPAEPARPNAKSGPTPALLPAEPKDDTTRPTGPVTLSAKGLGPYQVGGAHKAMNAAGLLGRPVSVQGCSGYTVVAGRRDFHAPKVVFHQGALQYVSVTSKEVATGEGARVGMSLDDVRTRYPQGRQLDDWVGAAAWIVASGGDALLFRFTGGTVSSIEAGRAQPLQVRFTDGDGC